VGVAGLLVALSGCSAPTYRFTASDADDVAMRIPRTWSLVKSGVPASSDGSPVAAGNWFAVYDAAGRPSVVHLGAVHATAPVALVRTIVITKAQGQAATDDDLRDVGLLPVTAKGRTSAAASGFVGSGFQLISDVRLVTAQAGGVHDVFSYDLGQGAEVFDQVAVLDRSKTRVHLFVVHCSQECYSADRQAIADTVRSFTVRAT
jgi:hypothetical protein